MNCNVCGTLLGPKMTFCPNCGTLVNASTATAAETQLSSQPFYGSPSPTPATSYAPPLPQAGLTPSPVPQTSYSMPPTQQSPYPADPYPASSPSTYPYNPYAPGANQPPTLPPPPPQQPRNTTRKSGLIIGGSVFAVLVLVGAIILGLQLFKTNPNQGGDNAKTATAISQANQTATAASNQNPYAPNKGTLVLQDPLKDNSKGYKWDETTMNDPVPAGGTATCGFSGGAYHVTKSGKGLVSCNPEASSLVFKNVAFEVKLKQIKGQGAGITVRVNQQAGTGYLFVLDPNGGYAIDSFNLNEKNVNNEFHRLHTGTNAAITKGLNQTNLVAMVADGAMISVYVNNVYMDSIQDSTYTSGQIGIYADGTTGCDVAANDARVWSF